MSGTAWKALLACLAALALAGCGGSDEEGTLTEDQARDLQADATQVETYVRAGRCEEAVEEADQLVAAVDALPAAVGKDVKDPLREMAQNLEDLAGRECAEDEPSGEPEPEPELTTPPVTPVDPTTATDTTEPADPSEDEKEDEEEQEDEEEEQPDEETTTPDPGPPDVPPGQQPGGPPDDPGNSGGTGGIGGEGRR